MACAILMLPAPGASVSYPEGSFPPTIADGWVFSFEISPAVGRCTSDTFLASLLLCGAWDSAGKGLSPLHQSHQQYPQWDYNTGMNRKL